MIPVQDTALYKMCMQVYTEHAAIQTHVYNTDLDTLFKATVDYLKLEVKQVEDEMVVTFVIKEGDIPNGD